MEEETRRSLVEHLEELRKRILSSLIVVFLCAVVGFLFIDKLLAAVTGPAGHLVFIKPAEAFFVRIKLALYAGVFLSMPFILFQAWRFALPALTIAERKYTGLTVPASYLLFAGGVAFAFYAVLPVGIRYLLSYGSDTIQPMLSVAAYVSFVTVFLLGFGLLFQVPLVLMLLTHLGIIAPQTLTRNRRYAVLLVFIVAGVVTPGPDIFSQLMMALPTLVLYEVGVMLSKLVYARKRREYAHE